MIEFFADSLVNGFLQSSMMGKFIVLVQLSASIVMVGIIIGKVKQLAHVGRLTRRVSRDVMTGRDVLEYYLARHPSSHTAIENIYQGTCERLFKLLSPTSRSTLAHGEGAQSAALTRAELMISSAKIVLPPLVIATAVSSQEVSIPRIIGSSLSGIFFTLSK